MKICFALILLFAVQFSAVPALACTCPPGDSSIEQAFDDADLVFTGEVQRLRAGYFEDGSPATLFTPQHIFKGIGGNIEEIPIATVEDGQSCDLLFWEKRSYIVYAKLDEHQRWRATICGRSNFLNGAEEEAATLKRLESDLLRQVPKDVEKQLNQPVTRH